MRVRGYLPLTAAQATELSARGSISHEGPLYLVTLAVRALDPTADEDAWEDHALQEAAAGCAGSTGHGGVAVLAVDLDLPGGVSGPPASPPGADGSPAATAWSGVVQVRDVASVHLGDDVLDPDAPPPDPDTAVELSWYDVTELAQVATLLRPG